MTETIKSIIKARGLLICPACDGEGELNYFCGHNINTLCYMCAGHGVIRSTKKQKYSKKCEICKGRKGGCGGCNNNPKGVIKWESYELFEGSTEDY